MQHQDFEKVFAEHLVVEYCITLKAGIDPIQSALECMGVTNDDTIVMPGYTYTQTLESAKKVTEDILFTDVDIDTYNMDYKSLETVLAKNKDKSIKAVIVSDLFGQVADYYHIRQLCRDYAIPILEDASFSIGGGEDLTGLGDYKMVGSYGDLSVTILNEKNIIGIQNGGGAVFTNNEEWKNKLLEYEHIDDNTAETLRENLARLRGELSVRRSTPEGSLLLAVDTITKLYEENLKHIPKTKLKHPYIKKGNLSSYGEYMILLENSAIRAEVKDLLNKGGFDAKVLLERPLGQGELLCARRLCETALCLPIDPYMTESEVIQVCDIVKKAIR